VNCLVHTYLSSTCDIRDWFSMMRSRVESCRCMSATNRFRSINSLTVVTFSEHINTLQCRWVQLCVGCLEIFAYMKLLLSTPCMDPFRVTDNCELLTVVVELMPPVPPSTLLVDPLIGDTGFCGMSPMSLRRKTKRLFRKAIIDSNERGISGCVSSSTSCSLVSPATIHLHKESVNTYLVSI